MQDEGPRKDDGRKRIVTATPAYLRNEIKEVLPW